MILIKQICIFLQVLTYYFYYKLNIISFHSFIKNSCIELTKLSYYYIKIFQWQIQDRYLNDSTLDDFFKQFTNNVPYNNNHIDTNLLKSLTQFYPQLHIPNLQPSNSGTIALIWKGKLNNKDVAIKIIRKNITQEIQECINITCFLLKIYNFITFNFYNNSNINIIKQNEIKLLEQCNFNSEINNLQIFYKAYQNDNQIIIPNVYPEFTHFNNNVIVMDFIQGISAYELTNEDKQLFAPIFNFFYNDSLFVKNLCHSDLHIGNITFIKSSDNSYKIGLYDFGLIYQLTKIESKQLFKLLTMLINKNRLGTIKTLVDFSLVTNHPNEKENLINNLLNLPIFLEHQPFDFTQLNIIFKESYKYNIQINTNSASILLAFMSSLYLSKIFADDKSVTKTFKNFLFNDIISCN